MAEVAVTEVEVQARGEARRGRDAYRREVCVMDVGEGGEGLLVPVVLSTETGPGVTEKGGPTQANFRSA